MTLGQGIALTLSCLSLLFSIGALIIALIPSKDYKEAMKKIKRAGKKK